MISTPLTEQQVKAFYHDLADLMQKHNIVGIAGIWIGPGDSQGMLRLFDMANPPVKMVVYAVAEKWLGYLRQNNIDTGYTHRIHEVHGSGRQEN